MIETSVFPSSVPSLTDVPLVGAASESVELQNRKAELRKFGLLLATLFLVFGEGIPALKHHALPSWPWFLAGLLAFAAQVWPMALDHLQSGWTQLGHILGAINTRVLLGILFFVVIVPIALVLRRLGLDKMNRAYQPGQNTYRIRREEPAGRRQLERTF